MQRDRMVASLRRTWGVVLGVATIATVHAGSPGAFTVRTETGLAHFHQLYDTNPPIFESPNQRYVAIWAERGLLKKDLVEDELRIYDLASLRHFASTRTQADAPKPIIDLRESTYKRGPIISDIHWLPDSSALSFLLRSERGDEQLAFMGLKQSSPRVLSLKGQDVTAFDVRDLRHYVYTVSASGSVLRPAWGGRWAGWDGTGQPLGALLFPREDLAMNEVSGNGLGLRSILWAAVGGKPHRVISHTNGEPIVLFPVYSSLALSPNGQTLATVLPLSFVPRNWVSTFRPPYGDAPERMSAGQQDLNASDGITLTSEYALIDLKTGNASPTTATPMGASNGWLTFADPTWSANGRALLLPNVYPRPSGNGSPVSRPCVAVFYLATGTMRCLEPLRSFLTKNGSPEAGFYVVQSVRFARHGSTKVIMRFVEFTSTDELIGTKEFVRNAEGGWNVAIGRDNLGTQKPAIHVEIKQALDEPPTAVVRDTRAGTERTVWDPNPQLKEISLGGATVYHWKDATGHQWTGGLYKPAGYEVGRRYPLVIQTHGFSEKEFRPSGVYSTAFAARALAASDMLVLQTPMCRILANPKEGPCDVAEYEGAVRQLDSQGLIDPSRVGIVGFSLTVYHVLEALTTSRVRFAAASITDGLNFGYWQYLEVVDLYGDIFQREANAEIGGRPFGDGLRLWLRRSPDFNMQKVHTPVMVVGMGIRFLAMWEPYATLRSLGKPVDLLLLNSDEHVLTEPALQLASQGGTVDWFRFWLQGRESASSAEAQQYRRWEELCDMQKEQNPGHPTWCVPARHHALPRALGRPAAGISRPITHSIG